MTTSPTPSLDRRRLQWISLSGAVAAGLAAAMALGCGSTVVEDVCQYDGQQYHGGDVFPASDGCNTCSCEAGGSVPCTKIGCITQCTYDDSSYDPGESFSADDGCNSCSCGDDGQVECTHMDCGCLYGGTLYQAGEEFPAGDGCNSCSCLDDGGVACTDIACSSCSSEGYYHAVGETWTSQDGCSTCTCGVDLVTCSQDELCGNCVYAGEVHSEGSQYPALDGCNTCTCEGPGEPSCSKVACLCNPQAEWWRHYAGNSPADCELIDFACTGTSEFQNDCGCGCEQDPTCPEVWSCKPPLQCDVEAIQAMCPFSKIAK